VVHLIDVDKKLSRQAEPMAAPGLAAGKPEAAEALDL
jgi:hypothetical protein